MKTQLILGVAALALAACGKSGSGSGGGSGAGISLQPGEWEIKTEVVNVTAEGLPPGMMDGMKKSAGSTTRTCMTAEDAKGPKGDLFAGDKSGNCKSENFSWSGGKISGKTVCAGSGPGGAGKTTMEMSGTYAAQNIDMTMKSQTDLGGKAMTMEMRVSGHRVGECSASSKAG
jgi:hypothetical protein